MANAVITNNSITITRAVNGVYQTLVVDRAGCHIKVDQFSDTPQWVDLYSGFGQLMMRFYPGSGDSLFGQTSISAIITEAQAQLGSSSGGGGGGGGGGDASAANQVTQTARLTAIDNSLSALINQQSDLTESVWRSTATGVLYIRRLVRDEDSGTIAIVWSDIDGNANTPPNVALLVPAVGDASAANQSTQITRLTSIDGKLTTTNTELADIYSANASIDARLLDVNTNLSSSNTKLDTVNTNLSSSNAKLDTVNTNLSTLNNTTATSKAKGVFNTTPPTLSDGTTGDLQLTSAGRLLVDTGLSNASLATSAKQDSQTTLLASVDGTVAGIDSSANAIEASTASADSKLTTANTTLAAILADDDAIRVASEAINLKTPVLGAALSASSVPVTIASDSPGLSVEVTEGLALIISPANTFRTALNDNLLADSGSGWIDLYALPGANGRQFCDFSVNVVGNTTITAGAIIFEGSNSFTGTAIPLPAVTTSNTFGTAAVNVTSGQNVTFGVTNIPMARYVRCRIRTAFTGATTGVRIAEVSYFGRNASRAFNFVSVNNTPNVAVTTLPTLANVTTVGTISTITNAGVSTTVFSAARTQNLTNTSFAIKGSAGRVYGLNIINPNATPVYVKLFNIATAVVGTTTPVKVYYVPANESLLNAVDGWGINFATAISAACVTGLADNNSTAPASPVHLEVEFI